MTLLLVVALIVLLVSNVIGNPYNPMKKFEGNNFVKGLGTPDCYKGTQYDIPDNWYWVAGSKDTSLPNFLPCHVFGEEFKTVTL